MENIIYLMLNGPMFWKVAAVIIVFILVASFKKLFKLVAVLTLIIFVYLIYLAITYSEPELTFEEFEVDYYEIPHEQTENVVTKVKEPVEKLSLEETERPKIIARKKKGGMNRLKDEEDVIYNEFKEEEKKYFDEFEEEESKYFDEFRKEDKNPR